MTAIYLAARYGRREELCGYAEDLRQRGHIVTSRWLQGNHQVTDDGLSLEGTPSERLRFAQEDWNDLSSAGICIAFTEPPRSTFSRGGRHVEWGLALAWAKRTVLVGPRENVFYCLDQVERYEAWGECMAAIDAEMAAAAGWQP